MDNTKSFNKAKDLIDDIMNQPFGDFPAYPQKIEHNGDSLYLGGLTRREKVFLDVSIAMIQSDKFEMSTALFRTDQIIDKMSSFRQTKVRRVERNDVNPPEFLVELDLDQEIVDQEPELIKKSEQATIAIKRLKNLLKDIPKIEDIHYLSNEIANDLRGALSGLDYFDSILFDDTFQTMSIHFNRKFDNSTKHRILFFLKTGWVTSPILDSGYGLDHLINQLILIIKKKTEQI